MKRRLLTETDFNLESIRKTLRLQRRAVKQLELIEKAILKWRKADRKASKEEIEAAHEFYAGAPKFPDVDPSVEDFDA